MDALNGPRKLVRAPETIHSTVTAWLSLYKLFQQSQSIPRPADHLSWIYEAPETLAQKANPAVWQKDNTGAKAKLHNCL